MVHDLLDCLCSFIIAEGKQKWSFAKRQMTWFRGMERRGFTIHWIDAMLPMEEKLSEIKAIASL